ncbi:MAG: CoA transferase [Candidatus Binatia bacterium]
MTTPSLALAGLRVVDLTDESGHLAGRILADLGAEVLKIEPPDGAATRRRGPCLGGAPHPDAGAQWLARNRGKRSVVLDLATDADRARLRALVRTADVLAENFAPNTLARLGLPIDELLRERPELIVASVRGYGPDGPWSSYKSLDFVAQATGGAMSVNGDADGPPTRVGVTIADSGTGLHLAVGILSAIVRRARTGKGGRVQGYRGQRSGNFNRVGQTVQQEIWPCQDGFVSFALRGGPARIPGLIAITKYMDEHGMAPPVLKDRDWTKYNNNVLTQDEVDAIAAPFAAFFKTKTMQELYDAACSRRLMLAPANTEREILQSRQLAARAYFTERAPSPASGERVRLPARFAAFPLARVGERAPALGDARGFDGSGFAPPRQTRAAPALASSPA